MSWLGAAPKTRACSRCEGAGRHQGGVCFKCQGRRTEKATKARPKKELSAERQAEIRQKARAEVLRRALKRVEDAREAGRLTTANLRNLVAETLGMDQEGRETVADALGVEWSRRYRAGLEFAESEGHFGFEL